VARLGRGDDARAGSLVVVSNEGSGDVTLIDASRDAPIRTIPVGVAPRALRLSPDGHALFAEVGEAASGVVAAALDGPTRTGIAVVDLVSGRRVGLYRTSGTAAFDLSPSGRSLVVARGDGRAAVLLSTRVALARSVPLAAGAEVVAASPDGRTIAIVSSAGDGITLLDVWTRRVIGRVATGRRPRDVAFTPDGRLAFVPCEGSADVAVIDVAARERIVDVPIRFGHHRPCAAAASPDGRRVFVTTGEGGAVAAIDVATLGLAGLAEHVGARPRGLAVAPDGRKVYVADGAGKSVAVLEAGSLRLLRRIPVGDRPWGVTVAR
jgi:YVTN family beta-propeller protein